MHYYEERYRLTGRAAAGLAASALLVVIGFLWHLPVIFLPLGIGLADPGHDGGPAARRRARPGERHPRGRPRGLTARHRTTDEIRLHGVQVPVGLGQRAFVAVEDGALVAARGVLDPLVHAP